MHKRKALNLRENTDQEIFDWVDGRLVRLVLPEPNSEILPGIKWGPAACPFTPAFWAAQVWLERDLDFAKEFRWGATLVEEIVGCLLGGHGITWEMNRAAFARLSGLGLLQKHADPQYIAECLSQPFDIDGRAVRYRFPKQKALFVAEAVNRLAQESPPRENYAMFREWIRTFRGIGPKTASWITRNFLDCSKVAIIDIHLFRAGQLIGLFSGKEDIIRDYYRLEAKFLALAHALDVDLKLLDIVIWKVMRGAGVFARRQLQMT